MTLSWCSPRPTTRCRASPAATALTYAPGGKLWTALRDRTARPACACSTSASPGRASCMSWARSSASCCPGLTVICGDSHTCTNGGARRAGLRRRLVREHARAGHADAAPAEAPARCASAATARSRAGVTAKDLALHIIGKLGAAAGTGYAIEYAGSAVEALDVEARLTLCNLTVELGARCGMVAPDQTHVRLPARPAVRAAGRGVRRGGRALAARCRATPTPSSIARSRIDAAAVAPTITWGTSPEHAIAIDGRDARPAAAADAGAARHAGRRARLHGPEAGAADRRHAGRLGLHRLVRQLAPLRPARRRRGRARPARRAGRHGLGRAGLRERQARGRGRGPATRSSRPPASPGASPAAACAWPPTASRCRRRSARSRPRTATSSAARARVRARTSRARRWPLRRRSPAASPIVAEHVGMSMQPFTVVSGAAPYPARAPTSTPTSSSASSG